MHVVMGSILPEPANGRKYPTNELVSYLIGQNIIKLSNKQILRITEIIRYIQEAQYNRQKLSELMGLSTETIKKYAETLIKLELIEFIGATKNGYYIMGEKFKQIIVQNGENKNQAVE